MTPCHSVPMYEDGMFYDETNCRFGHYSRCASCHKLYGEAKLIYTSPKGLRDSWTALSEVMTREHYRSGEGRPLRFVMSVGGLKPLGYKGEVRAQAEIAEVEEREF